MLSPIQWTSFRVSPTVAHETPNPSRPNSRRASFDYSQNSAFGRTNSLISTPPSDIMNSDKSGKNSKSNFLTLPYDSLFSSKSEKSCPPFQEKRKRRSEEISDYRENRSFPSSATQNEGVVTSRSFQTSHEKRYIGFKCISPPDTSSSQSSQSFNLTLPGARNVPLTVLPSTKLSRRTRKVENVISPPPQQPVISFSLSRRTSKASVSSMFQCGSSNGRMERNTSQALKKITDSPEKESMCEESFPRVTKKNVDSDLFSNSSAGNSNGFPSFPSSPPRKYNIMGKYSIGEMVPTRSHGLYKTQCHDSSASLALSLFPSGYRCPSPAFSESMSIDENTKNFSSKSNHKSHQCSPRPADFCYESPKIEFKKCVLESPPIIVSSDMDSPASIQSQKIIECPVIDSNHLPQISKKSTSNRTSESSGFILMSPLLSRSSECPPLSRRNKRLFSRQNLREGEKPLNIEVTNSNLKEISEFPHMQKPKFAP